MSTQPISPAQPAEPGQFADPAVHHAVRDLMATLPRGRSLDVPCGHGWMARELLRLGFASEASDIDPDLPKVPEIPFKAADLNKPLPYDDQTFDYIVCVAGLHRLYHPERTIREFARITRPGGKLIIGNPNYYNLLRRLRLLRTGSSSRHLDLPILAESLDPAARFRRNLPIPYLWASLEWAGFTVETVQPAGRIRFKWGYAFWIPMIWLANRFSRQDEQLRVEVASSRRMLLSTFSVVVATRTG